jgi:hypothetical protein
MATGKSLRRPPLARNPVALEIRYCSLSRRGASRVQSGRLKRSLNQRRLGPKLLSTGAITMSKPKLWPTTLATKIVTTSSTKVRKENLLLSLVQRTCSAFYASYPDRSLLWSSLCFEEPHYTNGAFYFFKVCKAGSDPKGHFYTEIYHSEL